jgi:hypothetical protein
VPESPGHAGAQHRAQSAVIAAAAVSAAAAAESGELFRRELGLRQRLRLCELDDVDDALELTVLGVGEVRPGG